jgi:hypothetical protein
LLSRKPGFGPVCFFYAGRYARDMKAIFLVVLVALLIAGCNDSPTDNSASSNDKSKAAIAPTDYSTKPVNRPKRAVKPVDATVMNKAIESFYVQEGRFPKDLLELVEKGVLPRIPTLPGKAEWDYDTNNGVVNIIRH